MRIFIIILYLTSFVCSESVLIAPARLAADRALLEAIKSTPLMLTHAQVCSIAIVLIAVAYVYNCRTDT